MRFTGLRRLLSIFVVVVGLFPPLSYGASGYTFLWKFGQALINGQFRLPADVVADSAGNVYVLDSYNNRVQKFTSDGTFITTWGSAGSGNGQFLFPSGITVDGDGNVWVADTFNNRIQKFTSSGSFLLSASQDVYNPTISYLVLPWGITYHSSPSWIDVANYRSPIVHEYTTNGEGMGGYPFSAVTGPRGIARSWADIYVVDADNHRVVYSNGFAYFGSKGTGNGQFDSPTGITIDSAGNLYIADTKNHRIQEFNSSWPPLFLRKWGTRGSGDSQFDNPMGVKVDPPGNVLVADTGNNRVQKFSPTGTFISKWGSGYKAPGQFSDPYGIAVDSAGNIYVVDQDNYRIQKFTSSGSFLLQWGGRGSEDGQFDGPYGIEIDAQDNIYISDYYNNRIQKFTDSGTFITKWGSFGTANGQFDNPTGVATDSQGNVYVADYQNGRIQKFTDSGTFITKWGSFGTANGQFKGPQGIATDSSGNVYVVDPGNSRIQKFTSSGAFVTKWGSLGHGNGQFYIAYGIAVDNLGNVFVADTFNHRIQKFGPTGYFSASFDSQGTGDGQLISPVAMAFDSFGNVLVADTGNHRIQVFGTPATAPTATTTTATGITATEATLNGTVKANYASTTVAFQYGLTTSYGTTVAATQSPITVTTATAVSKAITGLVPNTTYHCRVVAVNSKGTTNGRDMTFKTSAVLPTATTTAATGITGTEATLNGTVNANYASTTVTFQYGLTTSYGTTVAATQGTVVGNTVTAVSKAITGLVPNTTYHYRVVGVNSKGAAYGGDMTFTTLTVVPTATTTAATGITGSGATLNGRVNANNASTTVTFQYGLTTSYGTTVAATQGTVVGNTVTAVSKAITGLVPNTTYHYRVVGVNTAGTTNGSDMTFKTLTVLPTANTAAATGITATDATLNGTVNANNASTTVTFQYGLTSRYGTTVTATQSPVTGIAATSVSKALTGLTPNTTYHYRLAGVNSKGAKYGSDMTFQTLTVAPTVTTTAATTVTAAGAILSATANANNASTTVTFQYGLTASYGTTVTATQSPVTGTTNKAVSKPITGLTPNTTYHYRVVGVNAAGTVYGGDMTFTTLTVVPTVTTAAATGITATGATLNGMVNAKNASTTVTFQYGLTASYGTTVTATQSPVSGNTATAVSKAITGLVPNTTYYFRVVGVNSKGTTNGSAMTFKTLPVVPTLSTTAATSVTGTGTTLNGTVNANNASTTVTFQYGLTASYGTTVTATQSPATGATSKAVSKAITGLQPNTTYHYRVIGVNTAGTVYGGDMTFATLAVVPTITTAAATGITATGATLNGMVNAKNASTTVTFQYGLTTSYGTTVTATQSQITGSTATAVSKGITGLAPNTIYHYRAVGVNTAGTTNGGDKTFRTSTSTYRLSICDSAPLRLDASPWAKQSGGCVVNYTQTITDPAYIQQFGTNTVPRRYIVYAPKNLPQTPVPVVFVFPGKGTNAETAAYYVTQTRFETLADQYGFIVVYGNGVSYLLYGESGTGQNESKSGGDFLGCFFEHSGEGIDVKYVREILDQLETVLQIDRTRVYATGLSAGGGLCFELAMEAPDLVAAVAPVAGLPFQPTGAWLFNCNVHPHLGKVPIAMLAATADTFIAYQPGGSVQYPNGNYPGMEQTRNAWLSAMGISGVPTFSSFPDIVNSDSYQPQSGVTDSYIELYKYPAGSLGSEFWYYKAVGAGHWWPNPTQIINTLWATFGKTNQDIDFADQAWAFFQRHSLLPLVSQPPELPQPASGTR